MKEIISSIRGFNRFYVELIGVMKNHILDLDYSLTESRIIFEIDHHTQITAREIKEKLSLDEGYVSRLVKKLVKDKVITRKQSPEDKRTYFLILTEKGKEIAHFINVRSDRQIEDLLSGLDKNQRMRVVELMTEIKNTLSCKKVMNSIEYKVAESASEFEEGKKLFRKYSDSLSFKLDFQGFEKELEEIREKYAYPRGALILCFSDKKTIGCVGVREISEDIAELKRLYVQPEYRSLKVGKRLMELALDEAKKLRYDFIRLDTVAEMEAAIGLYKKAGFYEIEAYCYNPLENPVYMEKKL